MVFSSITLFVEGCSLQKWSEQYFYSKLLFQNLELHLQEMESIFLPIEAVWALRPPW